jgi:hypothetical protein
LVGASLVGGVDWSAAAGLGLRNRDSFRGLEFQLYYVSHFLRGVDLGRNKQPTTQFQLCTFSTGGTRAYVTDDRFDNAKTRPEGAAPGKLPEAVDAARARDKIGAFTCSVFRP